MGHRGWGCERVVRSPGSNCRPRSPASWRATRSGARRRRHWRCGRIVLGCAAGLSSKAVAAHEWITPQTVGKWRRRFVEHGLDGLLDEPRPGAPRKIDDAKVENVIVQ